LAKKILKKILIISPHFPPSNLAAVHRSRLFAQHLPSFGWEPIILTVHEKYYEEKLDYNLEKLLPKELRIEKVKAFKVSRPRLIGDIGLRGFFQLYKKAKQLIDEDKIDFLYIPIPSFYVALLGRWLNKTTGIKYGIDYIDPWVHHFPGSDKFFSRHWLSTKIAKFLEPIAIKKASLITGVAEAYYAGVFERNPSLKKTTVNLGMPYGGESADHSKIKELGIKPYLFKKNKDKFTFIYAGAMLPKAYSPLEEIFKCIADDLVFFSNLEFHFIGTGKKPDDQEGFNIKPLAQKYGLWETIVYEYPKRIPYMDVLIHLREADGIFVLGSTESHYTPSKVYQGVLAGKPLLAILHEQSSAAGVLIKSGAGIVLTFDGEEDVEKIYTSFNSIIKGFYSFHKKYDPKNIDMNEFEKYSAYNVTKELSIFLEKAILI
jgi:hypothetical protein